MIEELVRRYFREVWEEARPEAVEQLLAPDYVDRDPPPGVGGSREDQRRAIEGLARVTRERVVRLLAVRALGDAVAVRHDTTWVQSAPLFGLPPGSVLIRGCDLYIVRGGLLAESWHAESARSR